jgi:hypothetical protein
MKKFLLTAAAAVLVLASPSVAKAQGIVSFSPSDGQVLTTLTPTFTVDTTGFDVTKSTDNPFVSVSRNFQVGPDGVLSDTFGCLWEFKPPDQNQQHYVAADAAGAWGLCSLSYGVTYYWQIHFSTASPGTVDPPLTCSYVTCHTKVMTFTVAAPAAPAPDFSMGVTPSQATIATGHAASFNISLTGLNGFTSSIFLDVPGLPAGVSPTWNNVMPGLTQLTLHVSYGASPGTSALAVTGTAGSLVHSAPLSLTIVAAPPPPPPPARVVRCVVPKVVGRSLATAKRKLVASHCRTGRVSYGHSRSRHGLVYRQGRRPGARLARGTRIGLLVSLGQR